MVSTFVSIHLIDYVRKMVRYMKTLIDNDNH